jgi:hypothetical protein
MLLCIGQAVAIEPVKIDLNMSGRQEAETNEPGFTPWIVPSGQSAELAVSDGITLVLTSTGTGTLKPTWYKAGISTAKLISDGVFINPDEIAAGDDNVAIELRIKGLPAGQHTLQTYHNQVDGWTAGTVAPFNVSYNGTLLQSNLISTIRATSSGEATKCYTTFQVAEGADAVFEYRVVAGSGLEHRNVILNAIELGVSDADKQADQPYPTNRDEHVDADNDQVTLTWKPAANAVSHAVYFGTDSIAVGQADTQSTLYKGTQEATSYPLVGFYNMNKYYWRIDEIDAAGNLTKGDVWYFRTRQLAFAGAQGYGRFARGGRGGIVIKVTNLNDSGEGSLRDAIENPIYGTTPRTIIFDVSGRIILNSRLSINKPYITIAGQTAPGKGICISGHAFGIGGVNDVIIRHMRLRVGSDNGTTDGMGQSGSNHCIIDHASISWSMDEATSSRNARNHTFQHSLISETLNRAGHKNYPEGTSHGYAATIGGDIGSYHHNLLAHNYGRNWSLGGGLDGNGAYQGRIDIFNNVVYNWGRRTTDGGAHEVNFVNNYYKPGPESAFFYALSGQKEDVGTGTQKYYCNGNIVKGHYENLGDMLNGCRKVDSSNQPIPASEWQVTEPFFPSYAQMQTAATSYKYVLSDAGATQPCLDEHDQRVIRETRDGTFTYRGSYNAPDGTKGIIDQPGDVGGWEDYGNEQRPADYDSDHDGLPDWWENIVSHTNPHSPAGDFSDANGDPDGDGFTHLNLFLDWMGDTHYFPDESATSCEVNLLALTRGFTASPTYAFSKLEECSVSMKNDSIAVVSFAAGTPRLGSFSFTVTDADGDQLTRNVGLLLGSTLTSIEEAGRPAAFNVTYINPVEEALQLIITSGCADMSTAEVSLYNLSGQQLLSRHFSVPSQAKPCSLNVSSLKAGMYVVKVKVGSERKSLKILKK